MINLTKTEVNRLITLLYIHGSEVFNPEEKETIHQKLDKTLQFMGNFKSYEQVTQPEKCPYCVTPCGNNHCPYEENEKMNNFSLEDLCNLQDLLNRVTFNNIIIRNHQYYFIRKIDNMIGDITSTTTEKCPYCVTPCGNNHCPYISNEYTKI